MKTLTQLHEELKNGTMTVEALVNDCKKTIAEKDGEIHALLGLYSESLVEEQIIQAKKMFKDGVSTTLTGIPIVLKDNILVKDQIATGGSKILEHYEATYDATVVRNLKKAGAIILGRANLDEFAMGGSTENSAYGVTKNPHDIQRVAGGSSGGSAAVVAYGGVPIALGSDTGGSIRQPASFCGVVGLKPTYGNVSRYGVMAMGSSLDQIGPFGKTVSDVEEVYKVISGYDVLDSTSIPEYIRKEQGEKNVAPKKIIGVPMNFINRKGIHEEVLANFNESLDKLRDDGYTIQDVSIEHLEKSLSVYYIVMFAEVSSNLAKYDGIRFGLSHPGENSIQSYFKSRTAGFGAEVRRRILIGTYVLSSGYYDAYYNKANLVREMLRKEFKEVFNNVDVIAMPNAPTPAFLVGEKISDPLAMYLEDIFTVPVNIVGVPAIAIPSGKTKNGLPLGIQFIAPHMREDLLFTIGKDFERLY
ncbi:MAG: Asp-tRNA(Asn)/Glu-tRNA(Gln) amidotransferase subunit GatA [Candidatus Pacebacteria bacterium]|nr:Asp-tRNA(Asn)/Glu-tRNA(Gln) amidotransferase subunit GatA [Candidatus Paceibacterota bacterium]MBP9867184.1 Asp-tRNA(Asn)/Glu-tRNA(Gln) amidotransferase subunit GatA [Candidatus Paceibacterota bacterium]